MARKRAWWSSIAAALLIAAGLTWAALVLAAPSTQPVARPLAATLNVTTTADTTTCGTPCSLRGAIAAAGSGDTIIIPAGTFTLTSLFELAIDKSLTLTGAGSGDTIIQAAIGEGIADFRVFNITNGEVAISSVVIRHGQLDIGLGGGIRNTGTLTITNTKVGGNRAQHAGGISNDGMLNLTDSIISGNRAVGGNGGGIRNTGTLTITNSTVRGNTGDNAGGGISTNGMLNLTLSRISGNSGGDGSGIRNFGTVNLANSTISGNAAVSDGGGINNDATFNMTNSTITGNTANNRAGGVLNGDNGTVNLVNGIIAGNTAATRPDCFGLFTSLGHNLIGNTSACAFTPATGDLVNVDPLLGPLRDNGGPTLTHALLPGSPAIDSGDDAACPATDQRGVARPQGAHCDIGAFEFAPGANFPPTASNQAVTTTGDRSVIITLAASDPDTGDTLSFIIVSPPASGDLFMGNSVAGDKLTTRDRPITGDTVTYKARLGFAGTDRFSFKASDGAAEGNIATVTILVNGPKVQGTVTLEGMPNPISGARIAFSSGGQTIGRVFSNPEDGSFELQLTSGIYDVKAEKDGFLPATRAGVVLNQEMSLPGVKLLWGDVNGDGVDVKDLPAPAKNLGKIESPWLEEQVAGCVGLGAITGKQYQTVFTAAAYDDTGGELIHCKGDHKQGNNRH